MGYFSDLHEDIRGGLQDSQNFRELASRAHMRLKNTKVYVSPVNPSPKGLKALESRKIKNAVKKELATHGITTEKAQIRGAKVGVRCENCKVSFLARVADRKRGWARFCSKSCKASF